MQHSPLKWHPQAQYTGFDNLLPVMLHCGLTHHFNSVLKLKYNIVLNYDLMLLFSACLFARNFDVFEYKIENKNVIKSVPFSITVLKAMDSQKNTITLHKLRIYYSITAYKISFIGNFLFKADKV